MAVTQLTDVIIPDEFTAYQVETSLVSTALSQSGVVATNDLIAAQPYPNIYAALVVNTDRTFRNTAPRL